MRKNMKRVVYSLALTLAMVFSFSSTAAYAAHLSASPTSLNYGSIKVGMSSSPNLLTLTNTGDIDITIFSADSTLPQFVISGPALPLTLASRHSASFQVIFRPDSAKSFSGNLVLAIDESSGDSNENTTMMVPVSGTGIVSAPPDTSATYLLSANPSSLNLGSVKVGSSSSQVVTLTNTGNGKVSISQLRVTGASFSATGIPLPLALAPGQSASVSVLFAPTMAGSLAGSLSVISNATNSATIALSGSGGQPQISILPTNVSFGNLAVGLTNTQTVTLRNPGTANLSVTTATVRGAGFNLSGLTLPLTVAPGQSTWFTVGFTPSVAGNAVGSLSLVSDAPDSLITVGLSGTGVSSSLQLSASPTSLSFGNVTLGSTSTKTVTLSNTGNSDVTFTQIRVTGTVFSASYPPLPLTLSAGQTASFSVIMAPTISGSFTDSLSFVSNATNSPTISLSGFGVQLAPHSVALNWTASSGLTTGYYVYRSVQTGGGYSKLNSMPVAATTYTDDTVQSGLTYYYVTTAVNSAGVESVYSNEATVTIP